MKQTTDNKILSPKVRGISLNKALFTLYQGENKNEPKNYEAL